MQLGLLGMLLLGLANLIRAGGDRTGQSLLECVWTCVWSRLCTIPKRTIIITTATVIVVIEVYYFESN
eukprot:gene56637-75630_t